MSRLWCRLLGSFTSLTPGLAEGGGQVPFPQKMKNMSRTENKQPLEVPGKKRKASGKQLVFPLLARTQQFLRTARRPSRTCIS